ncbi:MltR family transcriptional regulator [Methylobacter sp. G7]|uniref:MltR family transcriptional regulator n=1 Tax=Methylobacter sp. G7 TaxID=3230117 RepID=UPI003D801DFC
MASQKEKEKHIKSKLNDFDGWFNEINTIRDDRGAAILAAAYLDAYLEEILIAFIIDDEKCKEKLFGSAGVMSTFETRAHIAYGLGLISNNEKEDCVIIAKIRNKFAHQLHNRSFKDDDIKSVCNNLRTLKRSNSKGKEEKLAIGEREKFMFSISIMALEIRERIKNIEHRNKQPEKNRDL